MLFSVIFNNEYMDQNLETSQQSNAAPNVNGSRSVRKILIIFIALICVIVLLTAIFIVMVKKYQPSQNSYVSKPPTGSQQTIKVTAGPKDATSDFFYFGGGIKLLSNTSQQQGNVTQSISNFTSSMTVKNALTSYESIFKYSGWAYTPDKNNTDSLATMHATSKDGLQWVDIKIAKDAVTGKAAVAVTYSIKK